MKPVWLLDVDGVINACTHRFPFHIHPNETWTISNVVGNDYEWPILWSSVVRDFLLEMNEYAEIRWHTTWQNDAWNISDALGMPRWPIAESAYQSRNAMYSWWKLPTAVEVVVNENRDLIWTDDDLRPSQIREFKKLVSGNETEFMLVTPDTLNGLSVTDLEDIRGFVKALEENPSEAITSGSSE